MKIYYLIEDQEFEYFKLALENIQKTLNELVLKKDSKIYNVTEAAKILSIAPQTLHGYIRAGYIEPLRINGSNKFTDEILSGFLSRKRQ